MDDRMRIPRAARALENVIGALDSADQLAVLSAGQNDDYLAVVVNGIAGTLRTIADDLAAPHRPPASATRDPLQSTDPHHLSGRQLYLVRCLLMRATEQGSPEPGLSWDTVVAGALEYAGTVIPPVTRAELDEVLQTVFNGPVTAGSSTAATRDHNHDHHRTGPASAQTTAASRQRGDRRTRPAGPEQPGAEAEP